jgi:hypothetical protein
MSGRRVDRRDLKARDALIVPVKEPEGPHPLRARLVTP